MQMNFNFRIGEKVQIREDLNKDFGTKVVKGMLQYRGRLAKVIDIIYDDKNKFFYYILDVDNGEFNWTFNLLSKLY